MSAKKKERNPAAAGRIDAEPGSDGTEEKEPMGKFFLLVFGIPFAIIVALGVLMALSD